MVVVVVVVVVNSSSNLSSSATEGSWKIGAGGNVLRCCLLRVGVVDLLVGEEGNGTLLGVWTV